MEDKNKKAADSKGKTGSLPALASVFNPEEFFEMDAVEETVLSRICCTSD